ncbi:MAG: choice-of-anchor Q domain-containing protein, partial [Blastocatellia bacterium]
MKRITLSLIALAALTLSFLVYTQSGYSSSPSPFMAPPLTFNVNSTADIFSPGGGTVTLRSAIAAANADGSANPSIINLPPGTYSLTLTNAAEETGDMTGDLDITTTLHSVTIAGSGTSGPNATIIDAAGLNTGALHDRAFHITSAGVTAIFQNLVIQNGQATNDGTNGASTDPATVNNGNRAGGGILNNGGSVTLTSVIIQSCQSLGRGDVAGGPTGGILEARGAGLASLGTGTVMITSSTLTGNTAQGGNGTAGANVNIASGAKGGSIYFEGGTLNIDGSQIDASSANGGTGSGVPQNGMLNGGNGGLAQGGGVWIGGGTVTVNNTTFDGAVATGGNSGGGGNSSGLAGDADGGALYSLGNTTVTNSTFHMASATGGNAGDAFGPGGFGAHNASDGGSALGGAILADGGTLIVNTATFASNSSIGGNGGNGGQTDGGQGAHGAGGTGFGAAIANNAGTVSIQHTTISLNNAQGGNSGVNMGGANKPARLVAAGTGGGVRVGPATVTVENTIIAGNTAANGAGDTTGAPTPSPNMDGTVTSNGHNLLGDITGATGFTGTGDQTGANPMLAVLANNGGPTQTMALMPGSPAIDAGVASGAMFDQRGLARTFDDPTVTNVAGSDGTDIGAFELQPICTIMVPANIAVSNDANQCGAVVNYAAPTGTCGPFMEDHPSGSSFPVGTTTVHVTSMAGKTATFTVTVNDTQKPAVTCPQNITANSTSGNPVAVTFPSPTFSDNCPGATAMFSPASGSMFAVGTTPV